MNKLSGILAALAVLVLPTTAVLAGTASPPTGYSTSDLLFEDQFNSSTLDTKKWSPWMGDYQGRWGGKLPSPYSAVDTQGQPNGNTREYTNPYPAGYGTDNGAGKHLVIADGVLNLIASPNNAYSPSFTWAGAAVSSYGKMEIPKEGGYVQVHAKLSDMRWGGWPAIWLLPSKGSDGTEFDIIDGGVNVGTTGTSQSNTHLTSKWFGSNETSSTDIGIDLSADYHTFGWEYIPGKSFKVFIDGALKHTWTSKISTTASYEVILSQQVASAKTNGWHSQTDSTHLGPWTTLVDNVQIYSLPSGKPVPPKDTAAPSVPANLKATSNSPTTIDLSWSAATDNVGVTGYKVSRNGAVMSTVTSPSYSDTSIVAGTTYSYTVSAVDAAGNSSAASAVVKATTTAPPPPPATGSFALGAAVATNADTPIMSRAGRGATICTQQPNVDGTILSGPQNVNGVAWWYVGFSTDQDCFGWAPQTSLSLD